jgi:hypothetical protein
MVSRAIICMTQTTFWVAHEPAAMPHHRYRDVGRRLFGGGYRDYILFVSLCVLRTPTSTHAPLPR